VPFLSPTVGATTTLDLNQSTGARVFVFTVSQATTIAFSNVPSSSFACEVTLIITNGSAFTVTWPASVVWNELTFPFLKASGVDIVKLVTRDGGTTWYGSLVQGIALPIGTQFRDVTQTSSGAGSPVTIKSFTLPAGKMAAANMALHLRAWGTTANNANAKTVRFNFGATVVFTITLNTSSAATWQIEAFIYRTGAATQKVFQCISSHGTTMFSPLISSAAETMANAITVALTATQTSAGDVVAEGFTAEFVS
jgi:hypothetical protein